MEINTSLRGYLDDSGTASERSHTFITFGGFVSTVSGWDWFEKRWPQMLDEHKVPYLHMRELWDRDGDVYRHLKANKEAEAAFLDECTKTIAIATEVNLTSSVRLPDIERFNAESGLNLDPLALALYGWIVKLREKYPDQEIELILDRCDKPHRCIDLAKQYAATDSYVDLKPDTLTISPIAKEESFRTILPIQAADFCAWEARRHLEEHKTWDPSEEARKTGADRHDDYLAWMLEFREREGRLPRQRKSAMMLNAWPPPDGLVLTIKT